MAFEWIERAKRASADELAAWLGGSFEDDRLYVKGALGAHYVQVYVRDGEPESVTAGYAPGLTVADVEAELGPGRELPRGPAGPFQLAFPDAVVVTTYDPPGAQPRGLVELTVPRAT